MITDVINHGLIQGCSFSTSAARNGSRAYSHSAEQLPAIRPEKTVRVDMAVKRLACDAELSAQFADLGAGLAHRSLREPQLGRHHFIGLLAVAAAGPYRGQTGLRAFDDQRVTIFASPRLRC